MATFIQFDASQVAPQSRPAPIPAGTYVAQITESEVKPLASGKGEAVVLTWTVLEGPCANRRIFHRINYRHTNPQAEQIGQSELSAVCHATGVLQLNDTQQLHMKPCRIRVKIRKDPTGQYEDQNEVGGVEPAGQQQPGMQAPMQAPAAAPRPAAATPPWQKRTA